MPGRGRMLMMTAVCRAAPMAPLPRQLQPCCCCCAVLLWACQLLMASCQLLTKPCNSFDATAKAARHSAGDFGAKCGWATKASWEDALSESVLVFYREGAMKWVACVSAQSGQRVNHSWRQGTTRW